MEDLDRALWSNRDVRRTRPLHRHRYANVTCVSARDVDGVAASGPGPSLICSGLISDVTGKSRASESVLLVDGKRTITCTQELDPDRGDFKRNVDITIDFNYFDSIEKIVLVKHLG